jgi:signal transduction histidine kinase
MVKEKAMKNGLQFSLDINDVPETLRVDKRKLKQIIYNLLSNAVKFTPKGGQIRVSARSVNRFVESKYQLEVADRSRTSDNETDKNESYASNPLRCLEVSVSDTGIGIKPEDQVCIFKPFEQVETTANRKLQGTGLGLSLTKNLVELHGGRIWVESGGEGKGSNFIFTLP